MILLQVRIQKNKGQTDPSFWITGVLLLGAMATLASKKRWCSYVLILLQQSPEARLQTVWITKPLNSAWCWMVSWYRLKKFWGPGWIYWMEAAFSRFKAECLACSLNMHDHLAWHTGQKLVSFFQRAHSIQAMQLHRSGYNLDEMAQKDCGSYNWPSMRPTNSWSTIGTMTLHGTTWRVIPVSK